MKEYIERSALLAIIFAKFNEHYGKSREQAIHDFYKFVTKKIRAAPAADVVEVVRCKDCEHWKCYGGQYADDGECWHLGELDCCMYKDDYCSKGSRKMDKEE